MALPKWTDERTDEVIRSGEIIPRILRRVDEK